MPEYLVVLRRQRLVYEHAVIRVASSAAHYAERDAKGRVDPESWETDDTDVAWIAPLISSIRGNE